MDFFTFWLISFIVCFLMSFVHEGAVKAQLKRKGYDVSNIHYSWQEHVRGSVILAIPFLNVVMFFIMLDDGKTVQNAYIEKHNLKRSKKGAE